MEEKIGKAIEIVKRRIPSLTVHADMQKAAQAVLNLRTAMAMYTGLGNKPTPELDGELEFMLGRVRSNLGATELQQVTQAVLHLAQAKAQVQGECESTVQEAKAQKTKAN